MNDALETYLRDLSSIRSSGGVVKETSGYGVLANLFNSIGQTLKPKVHCFIHVKNSGAGLPDGGLFTQDQLNNTDEDAPLLGIPLPSRGVIEVKATDAEVGDVAAHEQVAGYVKLYGQVLVTNYREFLLLRRGDNGRPVPLESFQLAPDEKSFWTVAAQPRTTASELGERFTEYLKRVLLHAAPLNNPRDVAFFLASYARDARARVEAAKDLPQLAAVRTALEEALGMKFEAEKGEHFFRSTLVQTLFYGVFSAWVLWHKEKPHRTDVFDWHIAGWKLHVPMISALFEQVATRSKLEPLGLVEVLDWTAAVLNRVIREEFFARFIEDHAVQYFYEPFLEAFDPELRKELGVWYTPPEIVKYQVARVDTALREELNIPDGLADPRVLVLDPCCGTGAYLVEVLRHIHKFLKESQGMGALAELYTKKAAQERIFGFELLPAPFVVAHLQMGLLLQNLGIPLDDTTERAAIYLTNALTGWEPPTGEAKKQLTFIIPEFKQEKEAADEIKQEKRIIVILGNPPYNGFAGVAVEEERDLTDAYRSTKRASGPQGQGLNDLYVRFFRMAERRIVEKSGEGIISFISNYSWLDGLSFTGMRERYLEVFDSITVDCLNGDRFKTGKLTPDGRPDPSVFSSDSNREGIQVGTAISMLVRAGRSDRTQTVKKKRQASVSAILFRHLWGKEKRRDLLKSLNAPARKIYTRLKPQLEIGLPFVPAKMESGYFKWPLLTEIYPVSFPGIQTGRDEFLVDVQEDALARRLENYFDPKISHEEMRRMFPNVMENSARFNAELVRDELRKRGLLRKNVVRFYYRPFDVRWLYWEPETKLLDEKRTEYFHHVFPGNAWLAAVQQNRKNFDPPIITTDYCSRHIIERGANLFPVWLKPRPDPASLFDRVDDGKPKANLAGPAKEFLAAMRLGNKPDRLFYHTLAVLHSEEYRNKNDSALRQDWPRVPLPKSREALLASANLGEEVGALLDTNEPVEGVTKGTPRPELKSVGELHYSGRPDFKITAGWGHAGKGGVTMPGKGKIVTSLLMVESNYKLPWFKLHDVFLNDSACWKGIPAEVWDYTIGGYQVIKKWLSYRAFDLLGRALTPDEAREVTHMARRIAALILLQPELDKNYQTIKSASANWSDFGANPKPGQT